MRLESVVYVLIRSSLLELAASSLRLFLCVFAIREYRTRNGYCALKFFRGNTRAFARFNRGGRLRDGLITIVPRLHSFAISAERTRTRKLCTDYQRGVPVYLSHGYTRMKRAVGSAGRSDCPQESARRRSYKGSAKKAESTSADSIALQSICT